MYKKYVSTRANQQEISFYEAIIQGIASDGGLIVPNFELEKIALEKLLKQNYVEIASIILNKFLDDNNNLIEQACNKAYNNNFIDNVINIEKVDNIYVSELFHGPTAAFKDMALSLLPHLMRLSIDKLKIKKDILILTATSGDTGKAALEGFKNVEGIKIIVFYPTDGVSQIQKQQMISQVGDNVDVVAVKGNFDDVQTRIKEIFNSHEIKDLAVNNDILLSSANSINIGRLLPQIVYYFVSYINLVNNKEINLYDKVNFCVPSGNFGNIFAAYLAGQMGLPINKLICASNKNNVLTNFINTGIYDINRPFYKTNAPAMDIIVSSNLERFLYYISNKDTELINKCFNDLKNNKKYQINDELKNKIKEVMFAGMLEEKEILTTIKECYLKNNYLLDTHTAIAYGVLKNYQNETNDRTKTIVMATASPYKFTKDVYKALYEYELDDFIAIEELNKKTKIAIPKPLQKIKDRKIRYKTVIEKDEIVNYVKNKIEKYR